MYVAVFHIQIYFRNFSSHEVVKDALNLVWFK